MTVTSRASRLPVAEKKQRPIRTRTGPAVTGSALADCIALQRALDVANRRLDGHDRKNDRDLAQFGAPLGGAKHAQQWMNYRNAKRPIPARDKLIAALFLGKRPEALFRSWEKPILPILLQVTTFAAQLAVSQEGQATIGKLLQEIAGAPSEQRERMMSRIRELIDAG